MAHVAHQFPKWQSVYHYLRAWKRQGVWVESTIHYAHASEKKKRGTNIHGGVSG